MPFAPSIEDLRQLAQRRLPRMFYDYIDAGSWTERTYRANTERLAAIGLRQRVAVDLEGRQIRSTMLGRPVAMPVALGPAGLAGIFHPDGEIHAARAAEKFGVPFALSTMSICSIEDVAAATQSPFWFQLYLLRDRGFSASLIERAKAARCSALILTVDAPLLGRRYKDVRLHRIDGGALLQGFGAASKARADLAFVRQLFALGRAEGERWLRAHAADVGLRPTINLADIP